MNIKTFSLIYCIIVMSHISISSHAQANKCLLHYNPNSTISTISSTLESSDSDIQKAKWQLDKADANFDDIISKKNARVEKAIFEDKMPSEKANLYLKQLTSSKFLLGRLHEDLLLHTLGIEQEKGHSEMFGDYSKSINRNQLLRYNELMKSKEPAEFQRKVTIANDMVLHLISFLPNKYEQWKNYSLLEKKERLDSTLRYRTTISFFHANDHEKAVKRQKEQLQIPVNDLVKWMDILAPILSEPQGKQFLTQVFSATLSDVYSVALSRTSSIPHKLTSLASSASLVGAPLLLPISSHEAQGISFVGLLATVPAWNALIFRNINHNYGGNSLAAVNRFGRRLFAPSKARKVLNETNEEIAEKEIKKSEEQDLQASSVFGRIKKELSTGISTQDIYVPMWGRSLFDGVALTINRIENLSEISTKVTDETNSIYEKLLSKKKNSDPMNKKIDETLIMAAQNQTISLLGEVQNLKIDLLSLSYALDQYSSALDVAKKTKSSTSSYYYFAETKSAELVNQKLILSKLANSIRNMEIEAAKKLNYLNELHTAVQVQHIAN